MTRPTTDCGDESHFVMEIRACPQIDLDGDFGPLTEQAVRTFQTDQRLESDKVVGPQTWDQLEEIYGPPPYLPQLLLPLAQEPVEAILQWAMNSAVADYSWCDRGTASADYTKGMALAWSTLYRKLLLHDPSAIEMAKADTGSPDTDALTWYAGTFEDLVMANTRTGVDTLRHLFVLLWGLGMRESSGERCCGRDLSAENVKSDTCESWLFQTSRDINTCSQMIEVAIATDQYTQKNHLCALHFFSKDVSCSESDWNCYGSGDGYHYQVFAKECPQYACESTAIGRRNRRQHWGPIDRYEVEVRHEVNELFLASQRLLAEA
jgi:hypothetical protein